MAILIAFALFLVSGSALVVFLRGKLPRLLEVPADEAKSLEQMKKAAQDFLARSKAAHYANSPELLLQKVLSQARVLSLKTEARISMWLEQLRKRAREKKNGTGEFADNTYWKKLRRKKVQ